MEFSEFVIQLSRTGNVNRKAPGLDTAIHVRLPPRFPFSGGTAEAALIAARA